MIPGIEARVRGNDLEITARAGARALSPPTYGVDDGHGYVVTASVLVLLIDDLEPHRPPIANADTATAVAGTSQPIDVLFNDSDPDGDPLILLSVDVAGDHAAVGTAAVKPGPASCGADRSADHDDHQHHHDIDDQHDGADHRGDVDDQHDDNLDDLDDEFDQHNDVDDQFDDIDHGALSGLPQLSAGRILSGWSFDVRQLPDVQSKRHPCRVHTS